MEQTIRKSSKIISLAFTLLGIGMLVIQPNTTVLAYNPTATPIPVQQSNTTVSVILSSVQAKPGDTFDITVSLTTDAETKGAQFELQFDPSKIEVISVDAGTFYSDYATAYGNDAQGMTLPSPAVDNVKGIMPVTAFFLVGVNEPKGPTGTGTLAVLHAKVKDGANGQVKFALSNIEVTDTGAGGKPQGLGGVKIQDAILAIGSETPAQQPTAAPYVKSTPNTIVEDQSVQPTVVLRTVPSEASNTATGNGLPMGIILPVGAGVLIVAVAVVILISKKNKK